MSSAQAQVAFASFSTLPERESLLRDLQDFYNDEFGVFNDSMHLYRVGVPFGPLVMEYLKELGIQTGIHYKCVHTMDCYKQYAEESLPNSQWVDSRMISIPFHTKVTRSDAIKVVQGVRNALARV